MGRRWDEDRQSESGRVLAVPILDGAGVVASALVVELPDGQRAIGQHLGSARVFRMLLDDDGDVLDGLARFNRPDVEPFVELAAVVVPGQLERNIAQRSARQDETGPARHQVIRSNGDLKDGRIC